jgi:hypothetical protein
MKADVEGHALAIVRGAQRTLLRHRPIFSFSCYHSFTEMYDVPNFLMSLLPDYYFEWHMENPMNLAFLEISFCGPLREL